MPRIDFDKVPDKGPVEEAVVAAPTGINFEALPDKEVTPGLTSPKRLPRWGDVQGKIPENMKGYEQDAKDAISVAATYDLDMDQAYGIQGKVKEELDEPNLWDKAQGSFKAGVGDVYVGMGNALKWAGMDETFSDVYVDFGERMRDAFIPPEDMAEFSWRKTIDPEWWATTVTRSVPFTLSLIPAAIVGAYAGTAAAGAAGLGAFGTTVVGAIGGAAASRPLESAFEAAAAYEAALARGDSEEDASSAADKVFSSNMMLVGLDAVQFATAFTPLKYGKGLKPSLMRRMSAGTGKLSAVAISEAGEERYQEYIQMEALGEEANFFDLDNPRLNEASTIGGIFGAGMGGAGSVWNALTKKTTEGMPEDVQKTFDDAKSAAIVDGADELQATREALDVVAATPEGKEHIETVLKDMEEKASVEMPVEVKQEVTAPTMAELMEKLQTEDLTESELGSLLDQFAGGREVIEEVVSEPVAAIKERLLATGMSEEEAQSNAALFDGFRVLAQRAGVSTEEIMARYLPEVVREGMPVEPVAPVVTEADRRAITDNPFLSDQITTEEQLADVESLRVSRERINETLVEQREEQTVSDEEMLQLEEAVSFLDEKIAAPGEAFEQAPTAPAPMFFSQLENVITEKMQKKASAQDILNLIKKGNVKAEEIKWSGIEDYLKGKKTVTKDEVLEYLQANRIEVTETTLGTEKFLEWEKVDDVYTVKGGPENLRIVFLPEEDLYRLELPSGIKESFFDLSLAKEEGERTAKFTLGGETKFSQYTLPGGENYKELLLTLPEKEPTNLNQIAHDMYGKDFSELGDEEANKVVGAENRERKSITFKSGHFDEPNILAHVRFNERTDAEGNKVLFLEEVQSDWAIEARKKGVKEEVPQELEDDYTEAKKEFNALRNELYEKYDISPTSVNPLGSLGQKATDEDLERLRIVRTKRDDLGRRRDPFLQGVPAAPFIQKNWHELALKRMLRYAAENGFDSVAWISGEQTADRYDLSKQVNLIQYDKTEEGLYEVVVEDKTGSTVLTQRMNNSELESTLGKGIAEKIIAGEATYEADGAKVIGGLDLKVGGEWAFTLYDKVIPNFLKKYGKKWGAKVETTQIENEGMVTVEDPEFLPQQSIPITDEMREAVLGVGQALFQPTQEGITPDGPRGRIRIAPDGINIDLFKNADQSTFVHETGHLYYKMLSDLAVLPTASEELKTDYQTVREWLGAEEGADISVDQQEQFARGFEAYLREGKAPSSALAEAFENFKQWLVQIYKSLRDLNVELTDEVRGVMDRMLADEGIEREAPEPVAGMEGITEAEGVTYEQGAIKTETPEFKVWFGDSKVVDEDGDPLVVYHGTTHDIEAFSPDRGNIENDFGIGFYFSNTSEDVEANYAGEGEDLTNRIEQRAEQLENEDIDEVEARQQAREELSDETPNTIATYLSIENPVVLGGPDETFLDAEPTIDTDDFIEQAREEVTEENTEDGEILIDEQELESDAQDRARDLAFEAGFEEEFEGSLADFIEGLRDIAHNFDEVDIGQIVDMLNEAALESGGMFAAELINRVKENKGVQFATDDEGNLASTEIIKQAFESAGFDGVIDNTVNEKFGLGSGRANPMVGVDEETTHYIAFKPEQIKSIFNLGAFSKEDARILYQAAPTEEVRPRVPARITNIRQLAKSLGGIDYNREHMKGELDKLKEDASATSLVINKRDDGVTLDQLREAAIEAGILTDEATLDDVLSALEVNLETAEAIEEELAKEERVRRRAETKAYKTDELRKEFIELSVKARKAYREGKNYGAVREARKLKNILARTRKIRLVRDYFNLTDTDLKKISRKNPLLLSQYEFKLYIDDVRIKAAQLSETQLEKGMLIHMIHEKDLGRVDNYRRVLGLPPIYQMTINQVREFAAALEPFHDGDVFLSERELETVDRTDLAGIATWREAKERLAAEVGISIEELETIKVKEWDEYKWDTSLAESNPFYKMLVTETTRKLLEADLRFHEIETELFDLARKSEKSRKRTFVEKAIPQDKQVMEWLETPSDERQALTEAMTPEQIDFARYMEAYFEIALKYLIQTKSLERGRENYFVHMRRSFLENVKEEGLVKAFKDLFQAYREDEAVFNIMDEDTGNILPLEKFFQFSLQRTGGIDPTTNVTKAFLVYAQMMEKKIALDELIPKMDIYAQSITPATYTPRGLEVDRSIKKFVNKYINNKKGRRIRWIAKQGGTIDVATRGARSFTTVIDLGFNIPSGIAAFVGEQATNFEMLGIKGYAKGNARIKTKKGKAILEKYEAFIGRSAWENFTAPGKQITERIFDGLFGLFHEASVLANKQFLLGAITDEEYNSGELSSERLAILKIEMGRFRVVPGTKSMVGSTSAGSAMMQYKTWAAPIIRTLTKDITTLVSDLAKKPIGEALTTREAREIYRVIGLTTTALIVGAMASAEDDDETFTGQVLKRVYRESMTLVQGVDPSLWLATPRLMGFMTQLGKNLKAIATLEEYKTKPGLRGVEGLQKQLTPRAFKQFDKPEKKERL